MYDEVLSQLLTGTVIVMDNAPIYRCVELRELCATAGCILEFLSFYLLDYNPTEKSFSTLKA